MSSFDALAYRFKSGRLYEVKHPDIPELDDLLNIDYQKTELWTNTLQFVKGFEANDALLWGDSGTGKSSLVKAMLGQFANMGLRLIQIYKSDIEHLSELYGILRPLKERFILFFDDLNFERDDERIYLLKSILDGDIEKRPENCIVYATSNRRNIVFQEENGSKFEADDRASMLSLAERFGLRLAFSRGGQEEFLKVVFKNLSGEEFNKEDIREKALLWGRERGFSARSAIQFIRYIKGRSVLG
ncbi:MAG: DUF815 domain-containing protein [Aquificaceae bacterium]